ncbi:MAG: MaoC/PaaZ C-terminal domain-containing protein [Thermodesulfobacteriota bacterium]|nr:MaoC/PaaZ C-terminal domain-containing protein [Thermodesulfobacteriota bacterium]
MTNLIRQQAIHGFKQGDLFVYKRTFTHEETLSFGDMTRDYNPVHYEARWSAKKGFDGLICHGLLVGSMICEFGGQVGWLATGMNFKFIKPVYFNDTIQCSITITKLEENGRAEAEAYFTNQNNKQVCCAHMTGRLPMNNEKKLLEQIVKEGDPTNKLSNKNDT